LQGLFILALDFVAQLFHVLVRLVLLVEHLRWKRGEWRGSS
jgi:hypothetical protein